MYYMTKSFICPFMSNGPGGILLCEDGHLNLPSTTKDMIRQQAQGQIVDFDLYIPKECCRAWDGERCQRFGGI